MAKESNDPGLAPSPFRITQGAIPDAVWHAAQNPDEDAILDPAFAYRQKLGRKTYEAEKRDLQIELLKLQRWLQDTGQRLLLIFEGRDAAGKGGTIKRFREHLNPRAAPLVALAKPSDVERGQWYFQRYMQHLPNAGEIVFFDRSWYNRAGVERVMGFCTPEEHAIFMDQAPKLEAQLVQDGLHLFKFWFSVSRPEQLRRFLARQNDPLKQWKLSPMDLASLERWDDYSAARNDLFAKTHRAATPWTFVRSDCKRRARLNAMRAVLSQFAYPNRDEGQIGEIDPQILGAPADLLSD